MNNDNKEKYLTLKEAADISGYAPDYVGQLIRKGKIAGKQIYCNVAWVTTEEAIKKYLEEEKRKSKGFITRKFYQAQAELTYPKKLPKFLKLILYSSIGILTIFIIFLLYVFSVNLEKKLQQKIISKVDIQQNEYESKEAQQDPRLPVIY